MENNSLDLSSFIEDFKNNNRKCLRERRNNIRN